MSNFVIINISHQKPFQRFSSKKTPHISIYLCDSPDFSSGGNFQRLHQILHITYFVTPVIILVSLVVKSKNNNYK